jgi:hypothetical protein
VKLSRVVEIGSNIAVICAAALLSVVLVKNYLLKPTEPSGPKPGIHMNVAGVNWAGNGHTLVLALQKGCHFCSDSAPFYQKLADEFGNRPGVRLVAVLPQSTTEGKQYLDGLKVPIPDVRQAPLSDMSVRGTPTLLLVDGKGVVTDVWVGKQPPEKESAILAKLGKI